MKKTLFALKKIVLVILCTVILVFVVSCNDEQPPVNNDGDTPSSENNGLSDNIGDYGSINNDEWDENK